ncbi:MAG TPA: protease complex subunit PrcB family protein [Longimicrobium sp.]|nr:protease complex subunit PrcB family protein [Longimicrobium sp.]
MHRFALSAVAFAALLSTSACCSSTGNSCAVTDADQSTPTVLPVTRLRAEPYPLTFNSGIAVSARQVVTDANTWGQVWGAIWQNHSPQPALPQIDFASERLVLAALGTRSSGGYSIVVDSAYQHADHVEVVVHTTSPGTTCGTTAAITQPVDVARIPAGSLPVRYRERATVVVCPVP